MLDQFQDHIRLHFSELLSQPFLLACSAGLDSSVLVDLCQRSNLNFSIAHANFQLRDEDSLSDALFVRNLAEKYKKSFYLRDFDTAGYSKRNKVSIQVAARALRYHWFADLLQEHGLSYVVTAHHADDALETFLINLSRGTGIKGLGGIPAKTGTIARPLLVFSRTVIMDYAKKHQVEWREDRTNAEKKYLRNKIRHDIVPSLKELHPTFLDNFLKTQHYLSDTVAVMEAHATEIKGRLMKQADGNTVIPIAELSQLKPIGAYLHLLFHAYGFTAWTDIEKLLHGQNGKEVRSGTHRLIRAHENLLLSPIMSSDHTEYSIHEGDSVVQAPITMTIDSSQYSPEMNASTLYLDKNTLKYPLTVRKWQKGDYFYPSGMQGKKKLAKYFKDVKMDRLSRERQWLLCSGDQIVWVIGRRADRRFLARPKSKEIVKFILNK